MSPLQRSSWNRSSPTRYKRSPEGPTNNPSKPSSSSLSINRSSLSRFNYPTP